jgi:hypothetical protein
MDLKDILSISGLPGLYKMVSQGKNAVIVESLETGKRMPAHARYRISSLADIAIFTEVDDKPLKDILWTIFEKEDGKEIESPKKMDAESVKNYFAEILPDYDRERVYVSDMKKALDWYNLLLKNNLITPNDEEEEVAENGKTVNDGELSDDPKDSQETKKNKTEDKEKDTN